MSHLFLLLSATHTCLWAVGMVIADAIQQREPTALIGLTIGLNTTSQVYLIALPPKDQINLRLLTN